MLFIDEIHRLQPVLEELLYSALEDYKLDIIIGQGPSARTHTLDVKPFTFVGATTRAGTDFGAAALAFRHRAAAGVLRPRRFADHRGALGGDSWALRSMKRVRKKLPAARAEHRELPTGCCDGSATTRRYAAQGNIDEPTAKAALEMLEVDQHGFDEVDRRLLLTIIEKYQGGPVGVNTLAAVLAEEPDAIEEIYEPFLMQIGFLDRTQRGRVATQLAYEHFGIKPHRRQSTLF